MRVILYHIMWIDSFGGKKKLLQKISWELMSNGVNSGVEKLTRSSLKDFLKKGLFCL